MSAAASLAPRANYESPSWERLSRESRRLVAVAAGDSETFISSTGLKLPNGLIFSITSTRRCIA